MQSKGLTSRVWAQHIVTRGIRQAAIPLDQKEFSLNGKVKASINFILLAKKSEMHSQHIVFQCFFMVKE